MAVRKCACRFWIFPKRRRFARRLVAQRAVVRDVSPVLICQVNRTFLDLIVLVELGCWMVCFWWMHRISARQNAVLEELRDQGERIEKVSKEEHELMKELHPAVQNIEKTVGEVNESV